MINSGFDRIFGGRMPTGMLILYWVANAIWFVMLIGLGISGASTAWLYILLIAWYSFKLYSHYMHWYEA